MARTCFHDRFKCKQIYGPIREGEISMSKLTSIIAGIGTLIGIYLFLANGKETTSIINSIGSNSISGIKTLQGR
jgi:hypothetical protein